LYLIPVVCTALSLSLSLSLSLLNLSGFSSSSSSRVVVMYNRCDETRWDDAQVRSVDWQFMIRLRQFSRTQFLGKWLPQ